MSDYNLTESTNITIRGQEGKDEASQNQYFNKINIPTREIELDNIKFRPSKDEKDWNIKFQSTFHFNHDIERTWLLMKNFDALLLLNDEGHFPCINIKGKNTWNVGNIFKGNFFKICPFVARVEENINLPETKEIKWLFNCIEDNSFFTLKISFFKVNEDNSTVVLRETKFEKQLLNNLTDKMEGLSAQKLFKSIDRILNNEPISLLKYESGIIQGKMEDIYNILSSQISSIAPNNDIIPNFNLNDLKINEKKQVSIIKVNGVQKIDVTLKCREINPGWNKWIIVMEISGGEPKKIPNHCFLIQLTKINYYECQLIMLTKFHEAINIKDLNERNNKLKYVIMSLKDFFENFYSPDSSN
jgi:hypothetical protein